TRSRVSVQRTDGGANGGATNSGRLDPEGVRVSATAAMAINPQTPTPPYAATTHGVVKSTDGGSSWSAIRPGPGYTRALAIDSQATTTLYAGTWAGVFKSTDGGSNWNAVNTGLTNLTVETLAIDPETPTTLYAGTYGGVFRSADGGSSWS